MSSLIIGLFSILFCHVTFGQVGDASALKDNQVKKIFEYSAKEVLTDLQAIGINNIEGVEITSLLSNFYQSDVSVASDSLIDNTGSLVDAIGMPRKLVLDSASWIMLYKNGFDTRHLVLHELLRIYGVDDDNYRVSYPLFQELQQYAGATENRPYCNTRVSLTQTTYKTKRVHAQTSLSSSISQAQSDGKKQLNILCSEMNAKLAEGISAQVIFDNRNKNGFSNASRFVSVEGQCLVPKVKKRKNKSIREEKCNKLLYCKKLYSESNNRMNYPEDAQEVIEEYRSLKC